MDIQHVLKHPFPLLGIPFKYEGRDRTGMDCWGLTMEVYKRLGVLIPDYNLCSIYPFLESGYDKLSESIDDYMEKMRWGWEQSDGTVVPSLMAIKFHQINYMNHVGVYVGEGKFIHTREKVGVCIDRVDSPAWARKIEGYYVYKGGAENIGKD